MAKGNAAGSVTTHCPCCGHINTLDYRDLAEVTLREVWCRCADPAGGGIADCDCEVWQVLLDVEEAA